MTDQSRNVFEALRAMIPNIPETCTRLTVTIEKDKPVRFTCEAIGTPGIQLMSDMVPYEKVNE